MCFSDYDCDVHNCGWYNVCIMQLLYISVITLTHNMQETNHLICCLDIKKVVFLSITTLS